MGAVNYYTSNYITMGVIPYSASDLERDEDFMQELQEEVKECGGTVEEALNCYIFECYENDMINVKNELKKHNFKYFHISIKPGYYKGFTLDIENNYPIAFDGREDRREALKEIAEIKQFLTICAGLGLVKCSPGWCTKYADYNNTILAIDEAIKEMRDEVKNISTWKQYNKGIITNLRRIKQC